MSPAGAWILSSTNGEPRPLRATGTGADRCRLVFKRSQFSNQRCAWPSPPVRRHPEPYFIGVNQTSGIKRLYPAHEINQFYHVELGPRIDSTWEQRSIQPNHNGGDFYFKITTPEHWRLVRGGTALNVLARRRQHLSEPKARRKRRKLCLQIRAARFRWFCPCSPAAFNAGEDWVLTCPCRSLARSGPW